MNIPDEAIESAKQAWGATCDKGLAGPGYESAWREAIEAAMRIMASPADLERAFEEGAEAGAEFWNPENPYRKERS